MKAKKFLALGLALLLSVSAAGCGASTDESTTSSEETKSEQAVKSQKVTIEFFQPKREAVDTFNAIIKKFNEKYPDIQVKQNTAANDVQVMQARVASNDFPDIYLRWPTSEEYKSYVKNGFIMDVTNEEFVKNSIPEIQKLFEFDGKMYGVPISMNAAGVIYNKKIFADAGVQVPTTWDEFINVCETLKSKNIIPIELTLKDAWTITTFNQELMGQMVSKDYFDKVIKGEATLADSKEWKELSEKTLKLCEYAQPDAKGAGYDQGVQEFANGKAAMMLQGLWVVPSVKKAKADIDLGSFALPATNNPDDVKVVSGIDVGLNIAAKTKNPEACKTFVAFVASQEIAQMYTDMDKNLSAIQGVKLNDPASEGLQSMFEKGKVFNWPNHFWPAGANDEYSKLIQMYIAKKDVDSFSKQMDKMFKDIQK
ncbi:MAG: extracellular solute-binding protein [Clostridia bacterium]|nr:extracellular solute-binding protein [Clostridia bacterium]